MRIPEADIERVLDATSIEDVIQDFMSLKREGTRLKACCPFHHEKTPSFIVTPSMNIYKCFSCGKSGNAITFLKEHQGMTYVEAVRYLAKRANIMLHEDNETMSAEEQEAENRRRAALAINSAAADFFAGQLYADTDKARFALKYLSDRWGEEFVRTAGLGFDPGGAAMLKWGREKGYKQETLIELGLLKKNEEGRIYDFFYDRVVFPIRSRSNQTVGFTARALDGSKSKYKNSPETAVFKKSEVIFGINVATRQAVREGFYLVEGAPDVYRLHSLGIGNAVAPLGTAWSRAQFEYLKRYSDSVCFIPDIDPPKEMGQYGPGIMSVMKCGRLAVECGLTVSVKEIRPEKKDQKADADSFIKSRKMLDELPKEDFIEWYTGKACRGKDTPAERADVMKEVGAMLACVSDKGYLRIVTRSVSRKLGVAMSILENEVNSAVKDRVKKKAERNSKMMDRELYSKYGFYEDENCYYSINKEGFQTRWSNFILTPLFHIKDIMNAKRLFKIMNNTGVEDVIEFKTEELVSLKGFKQRIESLGNFVWEAKEEQLTKLKIFIYEKTETATEITQLGWQDGGFFAFGNGIFAGREWLKADEYGIVRVKGAGNYYLPAASRIYRKERKLFQFERRFVHADMSDISFRAYTDKLVEVFGDNAKIGICFYLAALFKDVVTAKTKNFPILNLFGPKGSGKSELGHSLMSFFIINNDPPNLSSATDAALADAVAQCANALVHIDEYKNTIELTRREFIKGLYDGVGRTRMNMDRDKKRETTAVDCGVIISGQEMPTIDIAIFSRMLYLTFDTSEFSEEAKRRFDELKEMRSLGCTHMTLQILGHRKRVEAEFPSCYASVFGDMQEAAGEQKIEDRIFRNWVTPLAMFRTLEGAVDVGFGYKEMLRICMEGMTRQNGVCKSTNELASFWHVVDYLHQNGDIFNEADYRIKTETVFKGKGIKEKIIFRTPKQVLYLSTKRVMMLYRKNGKSVGESTLPVESLRHYLEISREYIGLKNAVRFKNISNERESTVAGRDENGYPTVRQTARGDWALAFDYRMLVESYGINLEVETSFDDDIDPADIDESDGSMPF